jgi:hypothetical protein
MMNFRPSIEKRLRRLAQIDGNRALERVELERCRRDAVYWFDNWAWTYDPRNVADGLPAYVPFDLFERQAELLRWIAARVAAREEGLLEKSRDVGWTWVAAGFALHAWRFAPGFKTTIGSRKEEYVDRIGDPDSIFEKMRLLLYRLPIWMRPDNFHSDVDDNFRRLINRDNGNVVVGEAGDNMGRGGRATLYLIDEGAFIERADRVEAAIQGNADCRIWASSSNGPGNLFSRKRHSGRLRPDQIFTFHYRDDPRKDTTWVAKKKGELEAHIWAAEYEIDYSASIEGVVIPGKWVEAATRLAQLVDIQRVGPGVGGLDVGGGKAKSVFVGRFDVLVVAPEYWLEPDTTDTANRALDHAEALGVAVLNYDAIGIGQGVQSTLTRSDRTKVKTVGINVGDPASYTVIWPDGRSSRQRFANLKAELWWTVRERLRCTWEHVRFLEGDSEGTEHQLSELLALPQHAELTTELSTPRSFRNEKGLILIESKTQLAARGVASTDFADALVLTFVHPADNVTIHAPTVEVAERGWSWT